MQDARLVCMANSFSLATAFCCSLIALAPLHLLCDAMSASKMAVGFQDETL
jgi:hypothetical protein